MNETSKTQPAMLAVHEPAPETRREDDEHTDRVLIHRKLDEQEKILKLIFEAQLAGNVQKETLLIELQELRREARDRDVALAKRMKDWGPWREGMDASITGLRAELVALRKRIADIETQLGIDVTDETGQTLTMAAALAAMKSASDAKIAVVVADVDALKAAAKAEGKLEGLRDGEAKGRELGEKDGVDKGKAEGIKDGRKAGTRKGAFLTGLIAAGPVLYGTAKFILDEVLPRLPHGAP